MKKIVVLAFIGAVLTSNAGAAVLTVENETDRIVTVGSYRGIALPSICESTNYGFCWEEAFIKFKPLSNKYLNIQGAVSVNMFEQEKTPYLMVEGENQIELLDNCSNYSYEPNGFVQEINGEVKLSEISKGAVCILGDYGKIVID